MRTLTLMLAMLAAPADAGPLPEQIAGWRIVETDLGWQDLAGRLDEAIAASPLNKVTQASATAGAKTLGKAMAGNKVVGVFAPEFAVRMLNASVAAGIEAPLRFYIVEREGGGSALAWKLPGAVFAPYDDGGEDLDRLAEELDGIMAGIAEGAAGE